MTSVETRRSVADGAFGAMIVAVIALLAFVSLPWLFTACRVIGMPGWIYGAEPLLGWMRLWALLPVWLMLVAVAALVFAAMRSTEN